MQSIAFSVPTAGVMAGLLLFQRDDRLDVRSLQRRQRTSCQDKKSKAETRRRERDRIEWLDRIQQ
jgi:hypothetical protein